LCTERSLSLCVAACCRGLEAGEKGESSRAEGSCGQIHEAQENGLCRGEEKAQPVSCLYQSAFRVPRFLGVARTAPWKQAGPRMADWYDTFCMLCRCSRLAPSLFLPELSPCQVPTALLPVPGRELPFLCDLLRCLACRLPGTRVLLARDRTPEKLYPGLEGRWALRTGRYLSVVVQEEIAQYGCQGLTCKRPSGYITSRLRSSLDHQIPLLGEKPVVG
jgi:hypothetical protein